MNTAARDHPCWADLSTMAATRSHLVGAVFQVMQYAEQDEGEAT